MDQRQDHPNIDRRIHPPILLIASILAAVLLSRLLPLPTGFPEALGWLGYALILAGVGLGFSAARRFLQEHTTLDPHGSATKVVTSGPYRLSRNPIYLGFILLLIGSGFVFRTYWGLILAPVLMALLHRLVIKHEEEYLKKKFGETYAGYRARVRRWL
jgi:protein-S-isoprenylcysteine O-methyltransferase Ste14